MNKKSAYVEKVFRSSRAAVKALRLNPKAEAGERNLRDGQSMAMTED